MKKGYKRLQFDFSENAIKRIKKIAKITDSRSNAEVVRNALKVYEFMAERMNEGYNIELEKDGKRLIMMPPIF